MGTKNTSDSIEAYIKELLAGMGIAELRRSELAAIFKVVPSQINYVIKTRFTESRGYVVESKRGGGGYIRIGKIEFSDHHEFLQDLRANIGERISQQFFEDLMLMLQERDILTKREALLLISSNLDSILGEKADKIRANVLVAILQQLDRKG
ncbi:Transcriptional regulator CtsR [Streptococcus sp. DD10]|uniref:CtsR family transcriptional regulator n=1 Tax=Streptococcus sp. DD10 TaxID=1777878 RepID=UPI0007968DC7|nr:CtsR family transcriptional regulator [Streptococcus sp. DD10]KXT74365.1 Transcriptional regulator CtsR [Streptococcus sp. DD10]